MDVDGDATTCPSSHLFKGGGDVTVYLLLLFSVNLYIPGVFLETGACLTPNCLFTIQLPMFHLCSKRVAGIKLTIIDQSALRAKYVKSWKQFSVMR